jgi:hypothetical protein
MAAIIRMHQFAASLRALLLDEEPAALGSGRPWATFAMRVVPHYPGFDTGTAALRRPESARAL